MVLSFLIFIDTLLSIHGEKKSNSRAKHLAPKEEWKTSQDNDAKVNNGVPNNTQRNTMTIKNYLQNVSMFRLMARHYCVLDIDKRGRLTQSSKKTYGLSFTAQIPYIHSLLSFANVHMLTEKADGN